MTSIHKKIIDDPLVSIIIPTYNRENVICNAIDSIITRIPHEIILVDDGSQDRTEQVVREKSLSNLLFIKHQKNQGAGSARNTGILAAKGKYIAFLDSDDTWLPYKLESQLEVLQSHPGLRACYTGFVYNKLSGKTEVRCPWQKNFRDFLSGCFICPGTTLLLEKEIFNEIGGYSILLPRLEDWDLLLRLSRRFSLERVRRPLAIINQSSPPSEEKILSSVAFLQNNFHRLIMENYGEKDALIFLGALEFEKFTSLFKNKKYIKSFFYLKNFLLSASYYRKKAIKWNS